MFRKFTLIYFLLLPILVISCDDGGSAGYCDEEKSEVKSKEGSPYTKMHVEDEIIADKWIYEGGACYLFIENDNPAIGNCQYFKDCEYSKQQTLSEIGSPDNDYEDNTWNYSSKRLVVTFKKSITSTFCCERTKKTVN